MPRRWHQVGGVIRRRRWQESPVTGKSTKETVKTIARGMPGRSGVTVVTMLVCFLFCMRGCGRIARPAFPAPFIFSRVTVGKARAFSRRENAEVCGRTQGIKVVIARSESDEAIHLRSGDADPWIASLRSQ